MAPLLVATRVGGGAGGTRGGGGGAIGWRCNSVIGSFSQGALVSVERLFNVWWMSAIVTGKVPRNFIQELLRV